MSIHWVSTSGTDTGSGTQTDPVKTFGYALGTLASQGDSIYLINDGTYSGTGTAYVIGTTFNGTNFDTDPGIHVKGVDASGAAAMATMAFTATKKLWVTINELAEYAWIEGVALDYTALRGTAQTAMRPVQFDGQVHDARINDCEVRLTTNLGIAADLSTNVDVPRMPYVFGASVGAVGTIELYNNVYVNAQMEVENFVSGTHVLHHNIVLVDCIDFPNTKPPVIWITGNADEPRRFYNNTVVFRQNNLERLDQPLIDMGQNNTTNLSFHSNLLFAETGAGLTLVANYLFDGALTAAQTTNVVTTSHNYIALGTNLAAESTVWDTSSSTGVYSYQLNSTWRGGGANAGTALNTNDVLNRTTPFVGVFSSTGAYTWTPGDYSHDLLWDLRAQVGRTAALDGGVVGAIEESINPPVGQDQAYSVYENATLSVTAASGLLTGATDPDAGDVLSITNVGTPGHGTISSYNTTTGSFVYVPDGFFTGADSFTFQVTDGDTNAVTNTASIDVLPVTDPPPSEGSPEYVDTAPFFRPTLEVATEFRIRVKKNRCKHWDISNYTEDREWNESTHRLINLGTSTTSQINLGGVASAQYLIVETDEDIDVSINDTARYWPVSKVAAAALSEVSTVYLRNNSGTNVAQVFLTVVD